MLSTKDKTPNPSGWGFHFHHTDPQRRLICVLGDMIMPASADDIAPISEGSLRSVEQALDLLARFITDRDLLLSGGIDARAPHKDAKVLEGAGAKRAYDEAKAIRRAQHALRSILRIAPSPRDRLCVVSYSQVRNGEPYMAFSVAGSASHFCTHSTVDEFRRRSTTESVTTNEHAGMEIVVLREPLGPVEPMLTDLRTRLGDRILALTDALDERGMYEGQTARSCTTNLHTTLRAFAEDIQGAATERELLARLLITVGGMRDRLCAQLEGSESVDDGLDLRALIRHFSSMPDPLVPAHMTRNESVDPAVAVVDACLAERRAEILRRVDDLGLFEACYRLRPISPEAPEFDQLCLQRVMTRNSLELQVRAEVERLNGEAQKLEAGFMRAQYGQAIDRLLALLPKDGEPSLFFLAATGEILLEKPRLEQVWDGGGRVYRLPARFIDDIRLAVSGAMLEDGKGLVFAPQVLAWLDKVDLDRALFDKQIEALRGEAREQDDSELIAICNSALDVSETRGGEALYFLPVVACRHLVADIIARRTKPAPTVPLDWRCPTCWTAEHVIDAKTHAVTCGNGHVSH